ncbi:MAG: sucrase ferredoxin [Pseudomonadales bacterium]
MSERLFCAEAEPREPLAGTADPVDIWILIEYRPTWRARAHEDNDLPAGFREWLSSGIQALAAQGMRARPQFIRQPSRSDPVLQLLLATPAGLFAHSFTDYAELLRVDLAPLAIAPSVEPVQAPHYFVCTNGQRDVCCARFGLPVYAALAEALGNRAWQITHLGGHRFAPNVLVLPDRALYGRVTPDALPAFLHAIESGRRAFAHLRGRTALPRAVQAAEAFLARDDLLLDSVTADDDHTVATFRAAAGPVRVQVGREGTPLVVVPSCGAEPEEVRPYKPVLLPPST